MKRLRLAIPLVLACSPSSLIYHSQDGALPSSGGVGGSTSPIKGGADGSRGEAGTGGASASASGVPWTGGVAMGGTFGGSGGLPVDGGTAAGIVVSPASGGGSGYQGPLVVDWRSSVTIAGTYASVSVGSSGDICALATDGAILCWGYNSYGQDVPPSGIFTSVSVGGGSACAVRSDGTLACWGSNSCGQATPPVGTFTSVSVSNPQDLSSTCLYACGIATDSTVACWGWDVLPLEGTFGSISTGGALCGVRKTDGTIACWGDPSPVGSMLPAGTFTSFSDEYLVPCGIRTDGTITCGSNSYTPPTGTFTAISVGFDLACAVATNGTMACWTFPCLDAGPVTSPSGRYVSVSVGAHIGCGVRTDGAIDCWGIGGPGCGY
jgi:hypothetical protein